MDKVRRSKKKRMGICVPFIASVLFMTGCRTHSSSQGNMRNVEERDYATILCVSEGKNGKYHFDLGVAREKRMGEESSTEQMSGWDCADFEELKTVYPITKGRDLSLSHLKVILLDPEGNDRPENIQKLIMMMDAKEEIAKTCPVLILREKDRFLKYSEESETPVGGYLEALLRAGERQGMKLPWLKDYLKALREHQEIEVYVLEPVKEGWTLSPLPDETVQGK